MPRPYDALLSDDPAWPSLSAEAKAAPNRVEILPVASDAARRACLEGLQVTTRSSLGALAHETGGLLVDGGFLRIFGSGHPRLPRALGAWNQTLDLPTEDLLVIADDVVGGLFAINAGALGDAVGHVFYFAPDGLAWEDTELGHSDWLGWAFEGDLDGFYETMRWPGWEKDVAALAPDRAFNFHPPLWTEEGKDAASRDRRDVPVKELFDLQQAFAETLGDDDAMD